MISLPAIREAAMRIAEQFKPEKIILFGSYAYGKPTEDSDVDYMILIRGRHADAHDLDIRAAVKFDFPVDVLVRSVTEFEKRIAMGDFFLMDINEKGKVLYEAPDKRVGRKSQRGFRNSKAGTPRKKVTQLR
jgi:predicted nucleotidyltransferase